MWVFMSSTVFCSCCSRHVLSYCAIWRPTTLIILRRYFYICAFVFLHICLFEFPIQVGQKWSFLTCPSCLRHLVTDHSAPGFLQIAKKVKAKSSSKHVYYEKHGFNAAEMWRKMAFFKSWFPFQNCDIITLVEIIVVNDFSEDFLTFAKNFTFGISIQSWTCLRAPHSFTAQAKSHPQRAYLFALHWLTIDQQEKDLIISGP